MPEGIDFLRTFGLEQYLYRRAGFGSTYNNASLDNFRSWNKGAKIAVNEIKKFFLNSEENIKKGYGLTIVGAKGTGKTHLLCAMEKLFIEKKIHTLAINGLEIATTARRLIKMEEYDEFSIIDKLCEFPILLIDDFLRGVRDNSAFYGILFYDLINTRYNLQLPTFITSNYTYSVMEKILGPDDYGEVIIDRIKERNGKVIFLSGGSYREKLSN